MKGLLELAVNRIDTLEIERAKLLLEIPSSSLSEERHIRREIRDIDKFIELNKEIVKKIVEKENLSQYLQ